MVLLGSPDLAKALLRVGSRTHYMVLAPIFCLYCSETPDKLDGGERGMGSFSLPRSA